MDKPPIDNAVPSHPDRKIILELRGLRFGRLRRDRGMTLQEVADKLGLSKSKMSLFESGKQGLSLKALERLEAFLCPDLSKTKLRQHAEERKRESDLVDLYSWARSQNPIEFDKAYGKAFKEFVDGAEAPSGPRIRLSDLMMNDFKAAGEESAVSGELVRAYKELKTLEQQVGALQDQVEAQAKEIRALRDLLDLKTQECLMRDKLATSVKLEASEVKSNG